MTLREAYEKAEALAVLARDFAEDADPDQDEDSAYFASTVDVEIQVLNARFAYSDDDAPTSWDEALVREFKAQVERDVRLIVLRMAKRLEAQAVVAKRLAINEAEATIKALKGN